ncbi:MAG: ExbD/TolR family protein [Pseudobdellovibrionaceae bacterium]
MRLRNSPLQSLNQKSTLSPLQILKNGGELKSKKENPMAVALPLTSLIDAFSIIVIYLLIGTQSGGVDSDLPAQFNLPIAEQGAQIHTETPTVRIQNGIYYINDEAVDVRLLGQKLAALKGETSSEQMEIIIQADKKMTYASLDPLLKAGSEAGIQKLKFAVSPEQ